MTSNELGILAGFIALIAFVPYIKSILERKTKPNKASWIIWSLVGIIIVGTYYAVGARDTMGVPLANVIGPLIIAALALKYGEEGWQKLDKVCLVGSFLGLIVWLLLNQPFVALVMTIFIDFLANLPTIRKSYFDPKSENRMTWILLLVANTINLFAIERWSFEIAAYPVFLCLTAGIIVVLLSRKK